MNPADVAYGGLISSRQSTPARAGDNQTLSFTVEADDEVAGMALIVEKGANQTGISWTFRGEALPPGASSSVGQPAATPTSQAHIPGVDLIFYMIVLVFLMFL